MVDALQEFDISISHETFRQITLGNRGAKYSELRAVADIIGPHVSDEVAGDVLEWLLRGPYNDGPTRPDASSSNPRYINRAPDATVIRFPIERIGRKDHSPEVSHG